MRTIYVGQGEIHAAATPCLYKTVLGSCVSVCLWDEVTHIGGLNHFVLPYALSGDSGPRFGDAAMPLLIQRLRRMHCTHLVAKVFGGASPLQQRDVTAIGEGNVALALAWLARENIAPVARCTGGAHGMAIRFYSATGEVQVRELRTVR